MSTKILIIGSVWVEKTTGAGNRMWQLLTLFLEEDWQITFVSSAKKTNYSIDLTLFGIKEIGVELNNSSFDVLLKDLQPNIVLFDRFISEEKFGWRVAKTSPHSLRVLDTEDLHFLRKTRQKQFIKGEVFTDDALLKADITKREIASILRCDLSLIISFYEMELLKNLFKIDDKLLYHLPFLFNAISKEKATKWNMFNERNHFVFVGNFFHKPNVYTVLQLKSIWKNIKNELPEAEMHIYGAYVNKKIQELHNPKQRFIIKGFVNYIEEIISKARVILAPIQFGAGIKGKLTEAMICGTPSVTTTIGAEGMHNNMPWNGFVEDNFNVFSKKAIRLYTDEKTWGIAQQNGIKIINKLYDKKKLKKPFINTLIKLQINLTQHRTENFIGNLLQHQTLQATKFMSKWIEEKNKH